MVVVQSWCHCHYPVVQQIKNCLFLEWTTQWKPGSFLDTGGQRTGGMWAHEFCAKPRTCFQPLSFPWLQLPWTPSRVHCWLLLPQLSWLSWEAFNIFWLSKILLWPNFLDYFQIWSKNTVSPVCMPISLPGRSDGFLFLVFNILLCF